MTAHELFFFALIYQRISDVSTYKKYSYRPGIYFRKPQKIFTAYIKILKNISMKYEIKDLKGSFAARFLACIESAQASLDYCIQSKFVIEERECKKTFLEKMRKPCKILFRRLSSMDKGAGNTFQPKIDRTRHIRVGSGDLSHLLSRLALTDKFR
jgi:hypothetical protein